VAAQQQQLAATAASAVPLQSFHAQIGSEVPKSVLENISNSMVVEARAKFHQAKFQDALNGFQYCLAVLEKTADSAQLARGKAAEYGALMHNIASCLHCMEDWERAKDYYHRALVAFSTPPPGRLSFMLYGHVDKKRCDFVKERLMDIENGRTPDLSKFLDGNGVRRDVTEDLKEPARPSSSANTNIHNVYSADPFIGAAAYLGGGRAFG